MSDVGGPIEFLSDGPSDKKGPTEYGGLSGLIDDHPDRVLSSSEKRGMMVRSVAQSHVDPLTGAVTVDESLPAQDPHTHRFVDDEWNEDGSTRPVDSPPVTESP